MSLKLFVNKWKNFVFAFFCSAMLCYLFSFTFHFHCNDNEEMIDVSREVLVTWGGGKGVGEGRVFFFILFAYKHLFSELFIFFTNLLKSEEERGKKIFFPIQKIFFVLQIPPFAGPNLF